MERVRWVMAPGPAVVSESARPSPDRRLTGVLIPTLESAGEDIPGAAEEAGLGAEDEALAGGLIPSPAMVRIIRTKLRLVEATPELRASF